MAKKSTRKASTDIGVKGVDLAEVERLIAFMQEHGLEEFEYEREGVHIRLKRASTYLGGGERAASAADTALPAAPASERVVERVPETPRPAAHGTATPPPDLHMIKSPIVGTFYAAPSADANPFVTVGAKVEPGQALCIIEAMKLMNEIESDVAGEVMQIFVENGKPVEYGEPLFGIRPRGKK